MSSCPDIVKIVVTQPEPPPIVKVVISEVGPRGPKGEEGDSAYAVALANGFVGTEAEWLASLKGEKGDSGYSDAQVDERIAAASLLRPENNLSDLLDIAAAREALSVYSKEEIDYTLWLLNAGVNTLNSTISVHGTAILGLQNALDGLTADSIAETATKKWWNAGLTRNTLLTGFSAAAGGAVTAGDTILSAIGKLENRVALNDAKVTGADRLKLDGSNSMTGLFTLSANGISFGTSRLLLDGANILALRNLANAQTLNIYNTYTDVLNYERGFFKWNSNVFQIGTEKLGTGSVRSVEIRSAFDVGIYSASNGRIIIQASGNQPISISPDNQSLDINRNSAATAATTRIVNIGQTSGASIYIGTAAITTTNHELYILGSSSFLKKLVFGGGVQAGGQVGTDVYIKSGPAGTNTLRSGDVYLYGENSTGTGRHGHVVLQHNGTSVTQGNVGIGVQIPIQKLDVAGGILAYNITLSSVPTADPHVVGQIWNDGGVAKISAG